MMYSFSFYLEAWSPFFWAIFVQADLLVCPVTALKSPCRPAVGLGCLSARLHIPGCTNLLRYDRSGLPRTDRRSLYSSFARVVMNFPSPFFGIIDL